MSGVVGQEMDVSRWGRGRFFVGDGEGGPWCWKIWVRRKGLRRAYTVNASLIPVTKLASPPPAPTPNSKHHHQLTYFQDSATPGLREGAEPATRDRARESIVALHYSTILGIAPIVDFDLSLYILRNSGQWARRRSEILIRSVFFDSESLVDITVSLFIRDTHS